MIIENRYNIYTNEKNINRIRISQEFLEIIPLIKNRDQGIRGRLELEVKFVEAAKAFHRGAVYKFELLEPMEIYSLVLKTVAVKNNRFLSFEEYADKLEENFRKMDRNEYCDNELVIEFLTSISKYLQLQANRDSGSSFLSCEEEGHYEFID